MSAYYSWARPVSASLTAEDCQPPGNQDGLSSIEDDESPGWRCVMYHAHLSVHQRMSYLVEHNRLLR